MPYLIMASAFQKKERGRPVKGKARRVKTSFTLEPQALARLVKKANTLGLSKSDFVNQLLLKDFSFKEALPKEYPKDFISRILIEPFFQDLVRFCEKNKINKLSIFGSSLNSNFLENSDIDVLVEFKKNQLPGLFSISRMARELSPLLSGRKIDLRTKEDLNSSFRDEVINQSLCLYER